MGSIYPRQAAVIRRGAAAARTAVTTDSEIHGSVLMAAITSEHYSRNRV